MANKQIKDFDVIANATGTSLLVQNNTTGTYNKISAENIASAATVLSKAITAQENVTIQKQLILDSNNTVGKPTILKSTGVNFDGSDAGIIEFNFTGDTNHGEVWGLKIKDGTDAWGIKAKGDSNFKNTKSTTLEIETNFTTYPSPIKFTGDTILTYNNSSTAAAAGVPIGGFWVNNDGTANIRVI